MKVKLTAILENDKPARDISEDTLKFIYQVFFDAVVVLGSEDGVHSDKVTVIGAEVLEE